MFHEPSGKFFLMMRMQIVLKMSAFFPFYQHTWHRAQHKSNALNHHVSFKLYRSYFIMKMWTNSP